ncbi:MAG: multicopper oxidase domain-containing protein, partial [Bacteroidota bacterium]
MKRSSLLLGLLLLTLCSAIRAQTPVGKTRVYHLHVRDTVVNYTGKLKHAIAINGSIPAPQLDFTEGDSAVIYVHNELNTETSIHWHGLILPNEQDGVPFLTTSVIKAHSTHLYYFPIVQSGTYWYHSHTKLQEQVGMYGAFIIHKKQAEPIKEYTVLLSDWIDENPYQVHRSLHSATDWYAIRKGATQNYGQAIKEGYFTTKLKNEWKRMLAMDVSDVYYDKFLVNGKPRDEQPKVKAGEKIRLRIINGSSSTYFWINYSGGKLTTVATDGADVVPVQSDRMIIGVAETYDVIITIPADSSYELLATSEDRTRSTSLWLGSGFSKHAKPLPRLKYFEGMNMMNGMMKMNGTMDDMGMQMTNQVMDMNSVMYPEIVDSNEQIVTLKYGMLRSPVKTTLPDVPTKVLRFELTGNMNRYIWTIDNKTVSE